MAAIFLRRITNCPSFHWLGALFGFILMGAAVTGCGGDGASDPGVIANPEGGLPGEGGGPNPEGDDIQIDVGGEQGGADTLEPQPDTDTGRTDVELGEEGGTDGDIGEDDGGRDIEEVEVSDSASEEDGGGIVDYGQCDAGNLAWSKRALETLLGRKAATHRELKLLADMVEQTDRATVVRGLTDSPEFLAHWSLWFMDELRVNRVGIKKHDTCFGARLAPKDTGQVAAYIRDNGATATQNQFQFNMSDVLYSALQLDDLSPLYRAYLFAMMAKPIDGANVGALEMDITRRQDFGEIFSAVFINRNVACLTCHNSQWAVTDSADPQTDRHWELPGYFEQALFGASGGRPEMEVYSMFRHLNIVQSSGGNRPWSMAGACGRFRTESQIPADPANISGYLVTERGNTANIWQVEESLRNGFNKLRDGGLEVDPNTLTVDGEEGFAYMVAARIVDRVWRSVHGTTLTLVHYFPRNQWQRDILLELTNRFVASGFSLRELLVDVLTHPLSNQTSPEQGCADATTAYLLPPVFNPWVQDYDHPELKMNSLGDTVHRYGARKLLLMIESSLGWPTHPQFHADEAQEEQFQRAIGVFTKDAEPGFDGVDFQGMLSWENRYGACASPYGTSGGGGGGGGGPSCQGYCGGAYPGEACWCDELCAMYGDCCPDKAAVCDGAGGGAEPPLNGSSDCTVANGQDWIAELICTAQGTPGVTVRDVVVALKDRLVNEAIVTEVEATLIADLFGLPSLDVALADAPLWHLRLRNFCGALLESPLFLIEGLPVRLADTAPTLVVGETSYELLCNAWAPYVLPSSEYVVECGPSSVTVTPAP